MDYTSAVALATQAHAGQTDRQGKPYVGHPLRVAQRARMLAVAYGLGPEEVETIAVAAALHDVLEDTEVTEDDLRAAGATDAELATVLAVTRPEGVTYAEFVGLIIDAGPLAMILKLADIGDNTDPARASGSNDGLRKRYAKASVRLRGALNGWEHAR